MGKIPVARDSSNSLVPRRVSLHGWLLAALIFLTLSRPAIAQPTTPDKDVLILRGGTSRSPDYVSPLESAIRARTGGPTNFYVEYLETARFDDEAYEKNVAELLQRTYSGQKLDLVLALSYPTLKFVLKYRDELFAGVPIVFAAVDSSWLVGHNLGSGVTGVTLTGNVGATIGLALHLHPDTNTVAIITGNSEWERYWLAAMHADLLRYQDRVREVDLVSLPPSQLLEKVAALPPQTFVLFNEDPQESAQPVMGVYDILAWVGDRHPTYCIVPICLGHGGIGGDSLDLTEQTLLAADLTGRVLSGERPDDIPVVHAAKHKIVVDWRELRRWKIDEAKLPLGSIVLYREPTLWQRVRKYAFVAIGVILAQALLIFELLWQRARKRKVEAVLRESEKRFRVLANNAPVLIWMSGTDKLCTYFNKSWLEFTGRSLEAELGNGWSEGVHPDDLQKCLGTYTESFNQREPFRMEYRLRRYDGEYRWILDIGAPRFNPDNSFVGYIGSAFDVTERKEAEAALSSISGRLLEAHEEERRHIARELHDDISQKLALLTMELTRANRNVNGSPEVTKSHLEDIRQHCSAIARDVQSLSHQLHYSKLDYLGLPTALRGFCKEFAKQYEVSVEFTEEHVPRNLPRNISLCLFRVAQEALHNAVKYSGTTQFTVSLTAQENEIKLVVSDAGAGFDVEDAKRNSGLGLLSMQERMHLVHGQFRIESRPEEGTMVVASVPLVASESSQPAEDQQARRVQGAA